MSVTRTDLVGKAQTVLGVVDADVLGPTLMHEHILCDIRPPDWRDMGDYGSEITLENHWPIDYGEVDAPGNLILQDIDIAIHEVAKMREEGGQTIVELSCGGLKPDPLGLRKISEITGANIVMGCGHYVNDYQAPENEERTIDSFVEEMAEQIFTGAWGTDVRAGILGEIGCQTPWTPLERRVMRAAVIAQQETGASLNIHPGRDADQPQEIADFLIKCGADMSRSVMSHLDRTIFDEDRMFRLADTGCVLEFDLFGMETTYYKWAEEVDLPNDGARLKWLRKLIDRGHLGQILISQDICYRSRLSCFGGHGYGHIFRNVMPMMLRRGFSETEVDTILCGTPQRLLTFI